MAGEAGWSQARRLGEGGAHHALHFRWGRASVRPSVAKHQLLYVRACGERCFSP